jgi:ferric-dicitrate binding protein FerR (iron transport regulator)
MEKNRGEKLDDLIVKLLSNDIKPDEYKALQDFLQSEENKLYFDNFREVWQSSGRLGNHPEFNNFDSWSNIKNKAGITNNTTNLFKTKLLRSYLKIAAAVIILISGSSLITWFITSKQQLESHSLETTTINSPLGSKCKVVLPDSSLVWLNAGSKITYTSNFNKTERKLVLEGEAFFDVTTNQDKPFLVQTSDIMVRALGTMFNVKAYPEENEIITTLEEGKIDIHLLNGKNISEDIVLNPNEKVVYHKKNNQLSENRTQKENNQLQKTKTSDSVEKIEINSGVNTDLYTSWKDKRWLIEGENLQDLAKIFERRYNISIIFNDEELKTIKFTGIIENETIEQLMDALRLTSPLAFEISKDTIWLNLDKQLDKKYKRFKIID